MQHAYKPKSAWEAFSSQEDHTRLLNFAEEYRVFLSNCKTERETIAWALQQLEKNGFSKNINDSRYFRPFREKALFAAIRGSEPVTKDLRLLAAHADSPRLDFKQHPFVEQAGIAQAKTHYYGGIRKYQWLARPLALHGVIVLENGQKISVTLGEKNDDPVFCVADLLPHLAKKQEKSTIADAFEGEKLNIVLGHEPEISKDEKESEDRIKSRLLEILNLRYGIVEEDMITAELEAVPAGQAKFVGLDNSMIGGYGQDDRICVFCAVKALLACQNNSATLAVMLWDKEEIGSDGATGASSRFLKYCIDDLVQSWADGGSLSETLLNSRALSCDVTAALDPDYQEVHEKQNAAKFGYGPCFSKFTGSGGKYGASEADAEYFAWLRQKLNAARTPWQAAELGKVDSGGGGTVALFLAAYGMNVIDLGPALLSMHSPFELASIADLYATFAAYKTFLE